MKNKNGFTLTEVLITLVIIGVIAAITVPSLINKTHNQEYVSKLKKAYSTLSQVTNSIIAEEGPATSWATTEENIYNLYNKKLLKGKECAQENGCSTTWRGSGFYKMVLNDSTEITFSKLADSSCTSSNYDSDGSSNYCARIVVDVNGSRKPNRLGRDMFAFVIKKQGLYPAGCDDKEKCDSTKGIACTCKVLQENAINY